MALMTRKSTKILGSISLVLLAVAAGVGLGVPTVNSLTTQAQELTATEGALATLSAQRDSLRATQANYPNVKAFSDEMLVKFPQLAQTPELLTAMTNAAGQAGITPNQIPTMTLQAPEVTTPSVPAGGAAPAAPTETDPAAPPVEEAPATDPAADPAAGGAVDTSVSASTYARIPIEVSILGDARQLQIFMNEIHDLDRAILITGFTVVNAEGDDLPPGTKTLQFVGSTYVYSKIPEPGETPVPAPEGTDPGVTAPSPTPAPAAP